MPVQYSVWKKSFERKKRVRYGGRTRAKAIRGWPGRGNGGCRLGRVLRAGVRSADLRHVALQFDGGSVHVDELELLHDGEQLPLEQPIIGAGFALEMQRLVVIRIQGELEPDGGWTCLVVSTLDTAECIDHALSEIPPELDGEPGIAREFLNLHPVALCSVSAISHSPFIYVVVK